VEKELVVVARLSPPFTIHSGTIFFFITVITHFAAVRCFGESHLFITSGSVRLVEKGQGKDKLHGS
jgi:hypothetical protein